MIRSHKLEHALRVIKYGVLEPLLSLAVGHTGFLFPARNGFIPPDWMNFAGGGDFQTIGRENVELLKRCAALQPYERVLEIGCGIGRNAAFLAEYLDSGTYAGFDVVRTGIIWCNRHIASQHPTFAFRRVDVRNAFYNPWGGIPSTVFSFPYEDYCFDLVFAMSVFTHMLFEEVDQYLRETGRVLRAGGRVLFSAFIVSEVAVEAAKRGSAALTFRDQFLANAVETSASPHMAVAYTPEHIDALLKGAGLRLQTHLAGSWSGLRPATSFQDVILATKK